MLRYSKQPNLPTVQDNLNRRKPAEVPACPVGLFVEKGNLNMHIVKLTLRPGPSAQSPEAARRQMLIGGGVIKQGEQPGELVHYLPHAQDEEPITTEWIRRGYSVTTQTVQMGQDGWRRLLEDLTP